MDRIYEAYMGGMGNAFAQKTQKRIHWICSKVQGTNILDVGCSQGITAILLAREGLQVTGLDISEETIHCAKQYLSEESEEIQSRVTFLQADFGCFCPTQSYDTVIMGEVLEHLLHPQVFVANASKFLKDNGHLIVTVPFGINDDPDHKQTFFYFELIHLLEQYFQITEKVFFGKWIGFVATKVAEPAARTNYGYEECLQVEQAFYHVEREHLNERAAAKVKIQKNTAVIQELQQNLQKASAGQQAAVKQMQDQNCTIEQVKKRNQELENAVVDANNRKQELEGSLEAANLQSQELTYSLKSLQAKLLECNQMLSQMQNEKSALEKKYESLSRSKLGRLTLWYWGLKRRKRKIRKESKRNA